MRDDDQDRADQAAVPVVDEALVPMRTIDLGQGQELRVQVRHVDVSLNIAETRHLVTPEMAELQLKLAQLEKDKCIAVADKQYVEPSRVMTRPVWASIIALSAATAFLFYREQYGYAVLCLAGMAATPILEAVGKRLRRAE
jgi:hypothetical protein